MIPMFRVWEMGNERATTTECLSDAQPILLNRQVRRYDVTSEKVVETSVLN
jgi:hypothetical protein